MAFALTLAAGSAALAAPGPSDRTHNLRVAAQRLDTRAHLALLDVYALDARLQQARARVSSLEAATASLRRQRATLRDELGATRTTLKISRRALALRLRALYEQGTVDPVAIVLGASSLGRGLQGLDDLKRATDESRRIVLATSAAHRRFVHDRVTLAADAQRLRRSLAAALAAQHTLASSVAARSSYVASLEAQAQLRRSQVSGILATAQTAVQKSQRLQGPTTPTAPAPTGGRTMVVSATCYDLPGRTATGMPVGWGVVAVDPTVIPLGTKLYIPGYGKGVAADVGGGIKGAIIDLWFPSYAKCAAWGRRTVTITIY